MFTDLCWRGSDVALKHTLADAQAQLHQSRHCILVLLSSVGETQLYQWRGWRFKSQQRGGRRAEEVAAIWHSSLVRAQSKGV